MKSNHAGIWCSLIWECLNNETAKCGHTGVCYAGATPPSSLVSFFTFNSILWADTVNLKFSKMLDRESEESRVHFWKCLYADELCGSLERGICWWIRGVPLFPRQLWEQSSKTTTGTSESCCKPVMHTQSPYEYFWAFEDKKVSLFSKQNLEDCVMQCLGGFKEINSACNLFRLDWSESGNEFLGKLLILVNYLHFRWVFSKGLGLW